MTEPTPKADAAQPSDGSDAGTVAPEAAANGSYRVQLPVFEGPLDLLLHLIEEHELDIRDIPIAFVAQKYVEYITLMQELNIDLASEYLVMAATLAHIKSKMLLPTPPQDQEEGDEAEVDPRAELVRRLLEYQKYKHAAEQLADQPLLGRDVFGRGISAPEAEGPAPFAGRSLFKLLDAFQGVLRRAAVVVDHQIDVERFSITDRINEISELLRVRPKVVFEDLFQGDRSRIELIITFLALLEMTRLRLTRLFQEGPYETIYVELSVTDPEGGPEALDESEFSGSDEEPSPNADESGADEAEPDTEREAFEESFDTPEGRLDAELTESDSQDDDAIDFDTER